MTSSRTPITQHTYNVYACRPAGTDYHDGGRGLSERRAIAAVRSTERTNLETGAWRTHITRIVREQDLHLMQVLRASDHMPAHLIRDEDVAYGLIPLADA